MLRLSMLTVVLMLCQIAIADDNTPLKSLPTGEILRLISRIEQLEKRIQDLEGHMVGPPISTIVPPVFVQPDFSNGWAPGTTLPYPQKQSPLPAPMRSPTPEVPIFEAAGTGQPIQPTPYRVPQPAQPVNPQADPPGVRPNATVPKSWQPFNFNGQTYYLVPNP